MVVLAVGLVLGGLVHERVQMLVCQLVVILVWRLQRAGPVPVPRLPARPRLSQSAEAHVWPPALLLQLKSDPGLVNELARHCWALVL